MEKQTKTMGKTIKCYNCGEETVRAKRWYHDDQDDLVCLDCAKKLEHTDTAYAGMSVADMETETVLSTNAKFWGRKGTLTMMEEGN